jgi:ABC-2 type transport system ATP-binding protein
MAEALDAGAVVQGDFVRLEQVYAHDGAGPRGRALGQLHGLFWAIGTGIHAVVGRPEDGTIALCELVSGYSRPRAGRVRIDGRDPARSPSLRRSIGSLLHAPALAGRTVDDSVGLARRVRGGEDPLARYGLSALARRPVGSLSKDEARAVELAIGLSLPRPRVLVLYEPFSLVAGVDRVAVRERLLTLSHDACVILATSAPADAVAVADRVYLLDQGRWSCADEGIGWPARSGGEFVVWLDDRDGRAAPELASRLGNHAELIGVSWQHAPESPGVSTVVVRALDLDEAGRLVAEACVALASPVRALDAPPLDLDRLIAAARVRQDARDLK